MFCNNCGNEVKDVGQFCASCGAKQEMSPQMPAENIPASIQVLANVPYKGGVSIRFFADRMEIGAETIWYRDIASVNEYFQGTNFYALIIFGYINAYYEIVLKNGHKRRLSLNGFSLYGIGNKRSSKKRYEALYPYFNRYPAAHVAHEMLRGIYNGETLTVGGVQISKDIAYGKKALSTTPIAITKENYCGVKTGGKMTAILDQRGKNICNAPSGAGNQMVLELILGAC